MPIPNGRGRPRAAPFGVGPGTALGLLRSRALPSAQVGGIVGAPKGLSNRTEQGGKERSPASARLFDRSCLAATRDPSRGGQLESVLGCGGFRQRWGKPLARRCVWSGPDGEEFAPDTSASARVRDRAELLTVIVSGTLRRNELGAIASAKNDRNFPQRRQPRRSPKSDSGKSAALAATNKAEEDVNLAQRYHYGADRRKTVSA